MQLRRAIDLSRKLISNCEILKSFSIEFRVKEKKRTIFIGFFVSENENKLKNLCKLDKRDYKMYTQLMQKLLCKVIEELLVVVVWRFCNNNRFSGAAT